MAKKKNLENICQVCDEPIDENGCFPWVGPPFGVYKTVELCVYCGHVVKPKVVSDIAIMGTSNGDVFSLDEMLDDGFQDKKRLTASIKAVGKYFGLTKKEVAKRLGK